MKLSTRARYGLRALAYLARKGPDATVQLSDIAAHEAVSEKYLEHLFRQLKAAGIVYAIRGAKGGYRLARDPESLTLLEIVTALEGPIAPVDCLEAPSVCERSSFCPTRGVWEELRELIEQFFASKTLAELVRDHDSRMAQGHYTI